MRRLRLAASALLPVVLRLSPDEFVALSLGVNAAFARIAGMARSR